MTAICLGLAGPAHAQGVVGGDFEAGGLSPGWTDTSSNAEATVVTEGTSYSVVTPTEAISFPSPTHALLLRGGWTGFTMRPASVVSDPFLVTRSQILFSYRTEDERVTPRVRLLVDDVVSGEENLPASDEAFVDGFVATTGLCGVTATVQIRSVTSNFFGGDDAFALFDDVVLGGAICADYDDFDGDGWCETGVDLDGDGACDGENEQLLDPVDCDDHQVLASPDGVEIPGDGIDNDCVDGDEPGLRTITVVVTEDVDGDGDLADGVPAAFVPVALWRDGGDGVADGVDDVFIGAGTSTAEGEVAFEELADLVPFWAAVDSRAMTPSTGVSGPIDAVWAEQTAGPGGALCTDGLGGTVALTMAGACYGGRTPASDPGAADLARAEHVAALMADGGDVTAAFGLSFAVVTHPGDGDDDRSAARFSQGSLRQTWVNANAAPGGADIRFVPVVPPDEAGVWTVALVAPLPDLTDPDTSFDGEALCNGFTCALGDVDDRNVGTAGGGVAVGIGPDGTAFSSDENELPRWPKPELALVTEGTPIGLLGDGSGVANLSIVGSGVRVAGDDVAISDVWIGIGADGALDVTTATGVLIEDGADGTTVSRTWVQVDGDGIVRDQAGSDLRISDVEVTDPGLGAVHDGIRLLADPDTEATGDRIERTFVSGFGGDGIVLGGGGRFVGTELFDDASVGNGGAGGRFELAAGSTVDIDRSWWEGNGDGGVWIGADTSGVTMTMNGFSDNVGPGIDLGGDGVTPNDAIVGGGGANDGADYPVIDVADGLSSGLLHLVGEIGVAGVHTLDVYRAEDDGDQTALVEEGSPTVLPHGEPQRRIGGCTTDANGAFDCFLSIPFGVIVAPGDPLCAVATRSDTGTTSEAGPNHPLDDVSADSDSDLLSDWVELTVTHTDPFDPDTDDDLAWDGEEVLEWTTDPLDPDTDNGGVIDGVEIDRGTDPLDPLDDNPGADTDGDKLTDVEEQVVYLTDPNVADTDGDGLLDGAEALVIGTDPLDADCDDGGIPDGAELAAGTDPFDPRDDVSTEDRDADGDGLLDVDEIGNWRTDPLDPDTDADGVSDGAEALTYHTSPLVADTDVDGLLDGTEIHDTHTDPLDADSDDGGVLDGVEDGRGTDPMDPTDDYPGEILDTDGDGLADGVETEVTLTDPEDPDTDDDGLLDGPEVKDYSTDPLDADTDDGGILDGPEVDRGTDPLDPTDDFPVIDPGGDDDPPVDRGTLIGGGGFSCGHAGGAPVGWLGIAVLAAARARRKGREPAGRSPCSNDPQSR